MSRPQKRKKSPAEKRRSARVGAISYVVMTAAALALTISTGSCAAERYRRASLATVVTGDDRYSGSRLTTCGFVRSILPEPADSVPCQVWNLMPFTAIGVVAAGWLVLDLAGLTRQRRD